MNKPSQSSMRTSVVLGALLLLVTSTTGCGVGMPTQPNLDQAASTERSAVSASTSESRGPVEVDDPSMPGGQSGSSETPAPGDVVEDAGPGNSDWGHSHKKPQ